MRTEHEVRELTTQLSIFQDAAVDNPQAFRRVADDPDWSYLCTVQDALAWVLGSIPTDVFLSQVHLNIGGLRAKAQLRSDQ